MHRSNRDGVRRRLRNLLVAALVGASPLAGHAEGLDRDTEVAPFARDLAARHGLDAARIESLLLDARVLDNVLAAIQRPAEAKPWRDYRPIFLTESRIERGAEFWDRHADLLSRAHRRFGVPERVIVAIIGVETLYGTRAGSIRVLDSLATLGFRYAKRASFFRKELEQFLVLSGEERLDPLSAEGSYAGAMGIPQFIPSSYRSYAVDFDGDGRRDLLASVDDAVGSVANYLARHGWVPGEPVTARASADGAGVASLVERGIKPHSTLAELARAGVEPAQDGLGSGSLAALIELDGAEGIEHWLGFENFYVITRYNHSQLYAMAVHQLGEAIAARRAGAGG